MLPIILVNTEMENGFEGGGIMKVGVLSIADLMAVFTAMVFCAILCGTVLKAAFVG